MPLVEITIGTLTDQQRRNIARGIARVLIENGQPEDGIVILFRQVGAKDVARGDGYFPYWPEQAKREGD